MTTQIKRRRGTTTEHSSFTGAEGELTVDTTKDTVVVHDGSTAGGHPLAKESGGTFTTVDINSGNIDNTIIGATTQAAISGTTGQFNTSLNVDGTVTMDGGSTSADFTFGDSDKAIFGAGSDLQIYHDGANSYITETGTGNLYITASDSMFFQSADNTHRYAEFVNGGAVKLRFDNSDKFQTTSTGIDVTGTATMDVLTVNTGSYAAVGAGSGRMYGSSSHGLVIQGNGTTNDFLFLGSDGSDSFRIANNGDISFYEDTGTTAKFFWDASAERLGIGTSSPTDILDVTGTSPVIRLTYDGGPYSRFLSTSAGSLLLQADEGNTGASSIIRFDVDGEEAMRIDSSGGLITNPIAGGHAVFNEGGVDADFRVESNGYANMLFVDGGANRVGINTGSPRELLDITSTSGDARIMIDAPSGSDAEIKFYNAGVSQFTIGHDDGTDNFVIGTTNVDTDLVNINKSGNVGIGVVPNSSWHSTLTALQLGGNGSLSAQSAVGASKQIYLSQNVFSDGDHKYISTDQASNYYQGDGKHVFQVAASGSANAVVSWNTAMTIDSSGNLLVGTTDNNVSDNSGTSNGGINIGTAGVKGVISSAAAQTVVYLNRLGNNGDIAVFRKDGATVGSIGSSANGFFISSPFGNDSGVLFGDRVVHPCTTAGGNRDDSINLGLAASRWDTIFAKAGSINTSDRNEKQDIEELSDAEQRVAVAAKGLLRKFRWKSAVAEKGDDARTHFGIIAQDLQDAFTAEGLDAARYGMWCSDTWWETQTDVEAVEAVEGVEFVQAVEASDAVYDEDGELVSEAVEAVEGVEAVEAVTAKDAYTRTDTFNTLADAPEDATERTRLGVRYSELLAFIISAI